MALDCRLHLHFGILGKSDISKAQILNQWPDIKYLAQRGGRQSFDLFIKHNGFLIHPETTEVPTSSYTRYNR